MIRMESINLIVQKYVWKVEYPSNYCHIHLNLMKNRTVERNDGCIIYKFWFTQNLCGGTILTAKGINKKFCPIRKKAILFDQNTIFPYEKWKEMKSNLKYFKVWGYLVKFQDPIPKRINVGPMILDCKIRLE